MAPVHPTWRLPPEIAHLPTGHFGSHLFLVDDFVRSCFTGTLPPNHVWAAARYNIPGIIAHESAKRDGELMPIPDLGDPPDGTARLVRRPGQARAGSPRMEPAETGVRGESWW
jgi:hypothetical protein